MNPINRAWVWKYQKNEHVLRSLLLHDAPPFVYQRRPAPLRDEVPVFTFHSVFPDGFEEQCRHLAENGYQALDLETFEAVLTGRCRAPEKSVFLTFDDGLKEVWTTAYPLLARYGLKATCFLIPGIIPEDDTRVRPNMDDVWRGELDRDTMLAGAADDPPVCTWAENRIMHESGVVQFQNHTLHHGLVFTSREIYDFVSPAYDPYFYGNVNIPIYRRHGVDVPERHPLPGMPIYWAKPRMQAEHRFFDDERVREACLERVASEGEEAFFARSDWRRTLEATVRSARDRADLDERFETDEERDRDVEAALIRSRELIESHLPGRAISHLCFPWYEGAPFAVDCARRTGHEAQYFGQIWGRPTNRPGDGVERIVRVDELFLQRLPGIGRLSLPQTLRMGYTQWVPRRGQDVPGGTGPDSGRVPRSA